MRVRCCVCAKTASLAAFRRRQGVFKPILLAHNVHRVAQSSAMGLSFEADKLPEFIRLEDAPVLASEMHFAMRACKLGPSTGCHLTTLNQAASIASTTLTDTPATGKKHGWLPLLTVLFLISYGLMTMLIVEQGRTIESQRALIRELFRDSQELSAVKKTQQEKAQSPSARTQASVTQNRSSRNSAAQNTQNPSTQAPVTQAPSSQAGPQHGAQNRAAKQKPQVRMPSKPASDLVDDVRTLVTI